MHRARSLFVKEIHSKKCSGTAAFSHQIVHSIRTTAGLIQGYAQRDHCQPRTTHWTLKYESPHIVTKFLK